MTTGTESVLNGANWIHFKLYRNPGEDTHWKSLLDWYHKVLRDVVRPFIESTKEAKVVLFGVYGPRASEELDKYDRYTQYETPDNYERKIRLPESNIVFIRLRIYTEPNNKREVTNKLIAKTESNKELIWNYEVLKDYRVIEDLGDRYGGRRGDSSIDEDRTVQFIRYWDAGCRYILSILVEEGNWDESIDVWGVPHKLNNSLGGWLRFGDAKCPRCGRMMYMSTGPIAIPPSFVPVLSTYRQAPIFIFGCPKCNMAGIAPMNI